MVAAAVFHQLSLPPSLNSFMRAAVSPREIDAALCTTEFTAYTVNQTVKGFVQSKLLFVA